MLKAQWAPYTLRFIETAVTSRQRMQVKDTFFVRVWDDSAPEIFGVGEVPLFRGLSAEDTPGFEELLDLTCREIGHAQLAADVRMPEVSSIRFGFEMALRDLKTGGRRLYFDTPWAHGRTRQQINGLVWMGDRDTMARRIRQKLDAGFHCVKLKIGGIDFAEELALLRLIRREYGPEDIELRLDANGSFSPENAVEKLKRLSEFHIHSLEQPIKAGNPEEMARICRESPIDIALDEELIGFRSADEKRRLLAAVMPRYIILKPALCGGFAQADEWISTARELNIGWWATSALESNVGLDAIGQWVSHYEPAMPQGLGTGQLYANNIPTPVYLDGQYICRTENGGYDISEMAWNG